jgi:hypothetical protein
VTAPTVAAELRAAAEKIRATAQAAEPGPWIVGPNWGGRENRVYVKATDAFDWVGTVHGGVRPEPDVFTSERTVIACQTANKGSLANANAAHIAMWHPAVAMVIAGWLFAVAIDEESDAETYHRIKERTTALEIARMINADAQPRPA